MVILHALGQCLIRTSVASIGPRAELGFALATRLIADRGRRLTRRYLTALFWPDSDEQRAAHSLSEALHRLRARGIPIESDPSHAVWISRDAAALDVERIPEIAPSDLARCDFSILPGFDPQGSSALLDWADEFRHHLRVETIRNTATVIRRAEREGDWTSALTLAEHVLRLDPEDSDALAARASAAEALRAGHRTDATRNSSPVPPVEPRTDRRAAVREVPQAPCLLPAPPNLRVQGAFVGREEELRILRDAWENTRRGRGRHVAVCGASGIGKTRLVRYFSELTRRAGAVVAEVSCDPGDARRPLSAFMRLVPRLQSLPGAAGCSPDLRPYLDRLTEFDSGATAWPEVSETPYMLSCIERAIDELVDAIADEQPLLIIFDNAHWADEESLRLIETIALAASTRAVLVVSISCEPASEQSTAACVRSIPISIGPLSEKAARAMVVDRSGLQGHTPDEAMIDWLVRAGEGNPLQLEELVSHWTSGGAPFELPPSLAALLHERIARLTPEARRVMQVVALLGRQATLGRVETVTSLDRSAFLAAVEQLGDHGLLVVDASWQFTDTGATAHVACRHEAIARAVLADLSQPARALLHREIATVLDAEPSTSADVLWDRAAHWSGGNEPTDVVRTTVNCARHLAAVGLADAGTTACRRLLEQTLPDAARRQALGALVHTLYHAWEWREVVEAAQELRSLESTRGAHDDIELCVLDAHWHLQDERGKTLDDSIRCASASDASASHRVRAAEIAIKLATNAGALRKLHEAFRSVSDCLGQPDVPVTDGITVTMMYHAVGGSLQLAAQCARDLNRRSSTMAEPTRLRALVNAASALARAGECGEAFEICEHVTHDAVRRHLTAIAAAACHRAANIALDSGAIEPAAAWTARFAAHAPAADTRRQRAVSLARARVAYHRGDNRLAERLLLGDGEPIWIDTSPAFAATSLATAIAVAVGDDRAEERLRSLLTAVLPLHRRLQSMGAHDFVAFALAAGLHRIGEHDRAEALLHAYLTQHRRESTPIPEPFTAMVDRAGRSAGTMD